MSIYLNKDSKIIVQGMTGGMGSKHTSLMVDAGSNIVGGVNARKAGTTVLHGDNEITVFGTVKEAMAETGADVSIVFVPPAFTKDAVVEAIEAGIGLVVVITEGVPVLDLAPGVVVVADRLPLPLPRARDPVGHAATGVTGARGRSRRRTASTRVRAPPATRPRYRDWPKPSSRRSVEDARTARGAWRPRADRRRDRARAKPGCRGTVRRRPPDRHGLDGRHRVAEIVRPEARQMVRTRVEPVPHQEGDHGLVAMMQAVADRFTDGIAHRNSQPIAYRFAHGQSEPLADRFAKRRRTVRRTDRPDDQWSTAGRLCRI